MGKRADWRGIDGYVGQRLRAFRLYRGWTQGELGGKAGVSYQQVQKYELGRNRISAGMLWRLATVLGVGISAFYEGVEERPPHPNPLPQGEREGAADKREGEGESRTGADPFRVIADRDRNPYPSAAALRLAFAIDGIRNPRLKAAIADLIKFAGALR